MRIRPVSPEIARCRLRDEKAAPRAKRTTWTDHERISNPVVPAKAGTERGRRGHRHRHRRLRGNVRPAGGSIDIGAYESGATDRQFCDNFNGTGC
jgi:hypothetical protein